MTTAASPPSSSSCLGGCSKKRLTAPVYQENSRREGAGTPKEVFSNEGSPMCRLAADAVARMAANSVCSSPTSTTWRPCTGAHGVALRLGQFDVMRTLVGIENGVQPRQIGGGWNKKALLPLACSPTSMSRNRSATQLSIRYGPCA